MRLLSLAPSNTEILYALGLGDQIIGVTTYCDYPDQAKQKPKVGSWITTQPEKIKELSPDLIFTSYFLPEPLKNWPASPKLQRGEQGPGKVIHVAPTTLSEVYESILAIGSNTNHIKEAKRIVKTMQTEFEQIAHSSKKIVKQCKNKLRVYMEEWPKPPMTSGNWVPELVEIAGGISFAKPGKPSCEFSFAELMRFDPHIMVFHWCGFGERFDANMIRKREGWNDLRAVKNDRLFVIDDSLLNRPGPRLVNGARKIQQILSFL